MRFIEISVESFQNWIISPCSIICLMLLFLKYFQWKWLIVISTNIEMDFIILTYNHGIYGLIYLPFTWSII